MNNTYVIIVEDEPLIAADLEMQLSKAGLNVIETFESGEEIINYLKDGETPHVILMDVQIFGNLDGVDVANKINKAHNIPIIFLTSNTDMRTFKRAKMTYPHAFLSKPFRIKDVLHAIELALEEIGQEEKVELEILPDRIFIRNKGGLEKVLFTNILLLEADGAYTKIITRDKTFVLSQTLKKTEEKIMADFLIRVHRSFIINIGNVDRITDGYVHLDKYKIPVSRGRKERLLSLFKTL